MASKNEGSLSIKDFLGASRFYNSVGEPPNKLYTIQNLWQKNKGELESVGGIVSQTATAIPGLAEVKHVDWYSDDWEEGLVVFYKPSVSTLPVPSGFVVATAGVVVGNRNFYVEFIGPGGSRSVTTAQVVVLGNAGISVTTPTNIPDYVHHVNYYMEIQGGSYSGNIMWVGSQSRRLGSFSASTIFVPNLEPTMTASAVQVVTPGFGRPTFFNSVTDASGLLTPGRKYYFALAPLMLGNAKVNSNGGANVAALSEGTVATYLVYTLQPGFNAITINFPTDAWKIDTTAEVSPAFICLMGTTPEDLSPLTNSDGTIQYGIKGPAAGSVRFTAYHVPYNTNMYTSCQVGQAPLYPTGVCLDPRIQAQVLLQPDSAQFTLTAPYAAFPGSNSSSIDTTVYGAVFIPSLPYSNTTARHLLSNQRWTQQAAIKNYDTLTTISGPLYISISQNEVFSRLYGSRLMCANGFDAPFYTNGYVIKSMDVDYHTSVAPTSKFVETFQNRIVFSGGKDNLQNTSGAVYYSEAGNPFSYTATPSATPVRNFINVNQPGTATSTSGGGQILGLGVYSQDLSTLGPGSFLVVGKQASIFSWNGGVGSASLVVQLDKKTGFAGPRCFTRTKDGPVFVGTDNVYLMISGNNIVPVGDEYYTILRSLTSDQLAAVNACYHDSVIKIGYADSGDGSVKNKEIWLSMNIEEGERVRRWVGPQALTSFVTQAVTEKFGTTQNFRVSGYLTNIFRRDTYGTYTNNGSPINYYLEFNDLDFQNAEVWKTIQRFGIRMKNNEAFSVASIFNCYDYGAGQGSNAGGPSAITSTLTVGYVGSTENYRLNQAYVNPAARGAIIRPNFTWTASTKVSIESLNFYFQQMKRRRL